MKFRFMLVLGGVLLVSTSLSAQGPSPAERVATLKRSLQESQTLLRQYEWTETTAISLKGEEKSRVEKRCHYGADGNVEKVVVSPAAQAAAPSGGRGRGRLKKEIVEKKKDEMKDYMEQASALIHKYVPPDPAQIQAAKDAGKVAVKPLDAGAGVRIEFADYVQPKDLLAIVVAPGGTRLDSLTVATYLGSPDDTVSLNVRFAALDDGASYTAETALEAKAKNIRVVVSNSGYHKLSR